MKPFDCSFKSVLKAAKVEFVSPSITTQKLKFLAMNKIITRLVSSVFFLLIISASINAQIPSKTKLLNPADKQVVNSFFPILAWQYEYPFADTFFIEIRETDTINPVKTINYSSTVDYFNSFSGMDLQNMKDYYWRVKGKNSYGEGPYSSFLMFKVDTSAGPTAPTPLVPNNLSTEINQPVNFQWTSGQYFEYHLQISKHNNFAPNIIDTIIYYNDFSLQYGKLESNTSYFWRVATIGLGKEGSFSQTNTFKTSSNPILKAPFKLLPTSNATNVPFDVKFVWKKDPVSYSYNFYYDTTSLFYNSNYISTYDTTLVLEPGVLKTNKKYYYKISATNGTYTFYSPVDSFTTGNVGLPPSPPKLTMPSNLFFNQDTVNSNLEWNVLIPQSQIDSFHIQLYKDSLFTQINKIVDTVISYKIYFTMPVLQSGTKYFWRISSINQYGESNFSKFSQFTTTISFNSKPIKPYIMYPQNNSININKYDLTNQYAKGILWENIAYTDSFEIILATNASLTNNVIQESVSAMLNYNSTFGGVMFTMPSAQFATTYYWKVRGKNLNGVGPWSDVYHFTTNRQDFPGGLFIAPRNNSKFNSTTVNFRWFKDHYSPNPSKINIQISLSKDFNTLEDNAYIQGGDSTYTTVGKLSMDKQYFSRMSYVMPEGDTTNFSPLTNFKISTSDVAPPKPNLIKPVFNGFTDMMNHPSWDTCWGANKFRLIISEKSDLTSPTIDSILYQNYFYDDPMNTKLKEGTQYAWKVIAYNDFGSSESEVWRFTAGAGESYQSKPTILSPLNNERTPLQPILLIKTMGGMLDISRNNIFSDIVFSKDVYSEMGQTANVLVNGNLKHDSTYYIRVKTYSDSSDIVSFIADSSFKSIPPSVPILIGPPNNGNSPVNAMLDWNSTVGALKYYIQIFNSNNTILKVDSISASAKPTYYVQPGLLKLDSTYSWQVAAKNQYGTSEYSAPRKFKCSAPSLPAPKLLMPIQGASTNKFPVFSWEPVNNPELLGYRLTISEFVNMTNPFFLKEFPQTNYAYIASDTPLMDGKQYYWTVSTKTNTDSIISEIRMFKVINDTTGAPIAPTIVSPSYNEIISAANIILKWSHPGTVIQYYLELDKDSTFKNPFFKQNLSGSLTTFTLPRSNFTDGISYFWRIKATVPMGESIFTTGKFTLSGTNTNPPATPILELPNDNEVMPFSFNVSWFQAVAASNYIVTIKKAAAPSDTIINQVLTGNNFRIDSGILESGIEYIWTVTAINAYGSNTSSPRKFKVSAQAAFIPDYFYTVSYDSLVKFTNKSIGAANYFWSFGDGKISNIKDPQHVYQKPGVYEVCLNITNSTGDMRSICKQVAVGFNLLMADFYAPSLINLNDTIAFTNISTGIAKEWMWDFGDGNTSNLFSPVHHYVKSGVYKICLTAKSINGNMVNKCKNIEVGGTNLIIADFSFNINPGSDTVHIRDLSKGNVNKWFWNLGDGNFSGAQHGYNKYAKQGIYKICLSVIDTTTKQMSQICKDVIIGGQEICKADFNFIKNPNNDTVFFSDASIGSFDKYFWDFGNGYASTLNSPALPFKQGKYAITLTVSGKNNCMSSEQKILVIQSDSCDIKADFNYFVDGSNQLVRFTNSCTGKSIDKFFWNFNNGFLSTLPDPNVLFKDAGNYNIQLTVTGNAGKCIRTVNKEVMVGKAECKADFTVFSDSTTVYFKNNSLGNATKLNWMFGDGAISGLENPVYKYPKPGYYTVSLQTYNALTGCMDFAQKNILVGNLGNDCQASFNHFSDLTADSSVIFINTSIGNNLNSYSWNFGDGTKALGEKVTRKFQDSGYYNVCLTVTDINDKCKNTACQAIKVGNTDKDCNAKFIYVIDTISRQVTFKDRSMGEPIQWAWSFGNTAGDTSQNQHPKFTYAANGYYMVKMQIVNAAGCRGTDIQLLNINAGNSIKAAFTIKDQDNINLDKIKEGPYSSSISNLEDSRLKTTSFGAAIAGNPSNFMWDFGDGTYDYSTLYPTHEYADYGTYNVCLTIYDVNTGAEDKSCETIVISEPIHIKENENTSIMVNCYPNPVQNNLNIEINCTKNTTVQIELYNALGSLILSNHSLNLETGVWKLTLDAAPLISGAYFLKVKSNEGVITRLVVKE